MKKQLLALTIAALAVGGAMAEPYDTLAKIKSKRQDHDRHARFLRRRWPTPSATASTSASTPR